MKKIGVLTFHNPINYGAVLQAYALEKYIETCGYDSELINYINERIYSAPKFGKCFIRGDLLRSAYNVIDYPFYRTRFKKFNNFLGRVNLSAVKGKNEFDIYEKIVVGSDQVWNLNMTNNDFTYYLEGVYGVVKCSYASSFGEATVPDSQKMRVAEALGEFDFLSVRENAGQKIVETLLPSKDVLKVLDPTFLLSSDEWSNLAKKPSFKGRYVLVYQLAYSEDLLNSAKKVAQSLNCKIITINGNPRQLIRAKYVQNAGPEEWLGYIKNAEVVLTNSFHGTVFSILFRKNFYTYLLKKQSGRNDRVVSLLREVGLENQMYEDGCVDIYAETNYFEVRERLNDSIIKSKEYLNRVLEL